MPHALPGSLAYLPDTYTAFNQVLVPYGKRHRELDLVVVGPNGIFVIEVKHYHGEITGAEMDRTWHQRPRTDGTVNIDVRKLRNPVIQVQHAVRALRRYLAKRNIKNMGPGHGGDDAS